MKLVTLLFFIISSTCFAESPVQSFRSSYLSNPVTTGAWNHMVTVSAQAARSVEIFDSSGQTLQFGFGPAGSEVSQIYIYPGGNGKVPMDIPKNTQISVKAISGNATSGELDFNFSN